VRKSKATLTTGALRCSAALASSVLRDLIHEEFVRSIKLPRLQLSYLLELGTEVRDLIRMVHRHHALVACADLIFRGIPWYPQDFVRIDGLAGRLLLLSSRFSGVAASEPLKEAMSVD